MSVLESHSDKPLAGKISRRALLNTAAIIAAASAIAATGGTAALIPRRFELEICLEQLRGKPGTIAIGHHYLALHPQHNNQRELSAAIQHDMAAHRQSLSALIKNDFCSDRTLLVDGWPLALTEARLCALAHLSNTA